MASVSWDTFERYRQKGLDARRAGQWDSARVYLLEAARAIVELSKQAQGEELREARRQTAAKLLELAKATAGEIDATFFRISPADVLSKWVGEAEQNIKKLFDAAASEKRAIIFIDEIEALVPARRDEGSSVMQRVVPQILQGMEGFDEKTVSPILVMRATNVPWQLDPAVLRPGRFDEKVFIPLPDPAARRKMLEIYLGKRPVDGDVDLDALAQHLDGYSGAVIKYLCDRAATVPF